MRFASVTFILFLFFICLFKYLLTLTAVMVKRPVPGRLANLNRWTSSLFVNYNLLCWRRPMLFLVLYPFSFFTSDKCFKNCNFCVVCIDKFFIKTSMNNVFSVFLLQFLKLISIILTPAATPKIINTFRIDKFVQYTYYSKHFFRAIARARQLCVSISISNVFLF